MPLLNVGSASAHFRQHVQPWIHGSVFAPLAERGFHVIHQDLHPAEGVDVVGDIQAAACQAEVRTRGVSSILCSNVLEHVPSPRTFARVLMQLVPTGGRLLVTVPHAFPYHPDPIDTLFRPGLSELQSLFEGTEVLGAEVIPAGRLHDLVLQRPSQILCKLRESIAVRGRDSAPMDPKPSTSASGRAAAMVSTLRQWVIPWSYKQFEVTCLDLRRR